MNNDAFEYFLYAAEGFNLRVERLADQFSHLSPDDFQQIVRWMRGAFEAGRDSK